MTKEKYEEGVKSLEEEFDKKKKDLARQYALANNPYKKGDILSDGSNIIKIDTIKISMGYHGDVPYCVYEGVSLNKNLTPNKKNKTAAIYPNRNVQLIK